MRILNLSEFLEQRGIQTVIADWDTECVVLGREDWNREDLDEIIDGARGQQLRFYSQEMLFLC